MGKEKDSRSPNELSIAYRQLGTVNIEELGHALIEDIHAIKDIYNVSYVTGAYLTIFATNEYGDEVNIRRPTGGKVSRIDTHHYRPACKDYEL